MIDLALIGLENMQRHFGCGAFTRTVGADKCDDLTAMDRQVNIAHKPSPVAINAGTFQIDQWFPL